MQTVKSREAKFKRKNMYNPDKKAKRLGNLGQSKITKSRLQALLPKGSSHQITDELLDMISRAEEDTGLPQAMIEEDIMSYMYLLKKVPRTKVNELVNAVKFCNLKRNHSNEKAWSIVFPDRYDRLISEGRRIDSHASMYNSSKLVQEIDKEMLIPFHIQYAPYAHSSIKKLYELVNGRASPNAKGEAMTVTPMVQMLAAKSLLEATKMPETAKIDLTVSRGEEEMSMQQQMNDQLAQLVKMQKQRLTDGADLSDVQKIGINFNNAECIDAELEEQ